MEQVEQFLGGQRDYALIKGATGPLVYIPEDSRKCNNSYPAGHLWIYSALYQVTSKGKDIFTAQLTFVLVYLATLAITLATYRTAKVSVLKFITDGRSLRTFSRFYLCRSDYIASTFFVSSTIAGPNYF